MSSSVSVVPAPPAYAEKTSESQTKSTLALFPRQQREPDVRIAAGQELDIKGECIPVYVGLKAQRKEFYVHRRLFTSRSQFLNTRGIARLHEEIQLPEFDPTTFQLYIVLTYTGLLATKDLPSEWRTLIDVYILAEKLEDSQAKHLTADAMHSYLREKLHRNNGKLRASDRTRDQFTAESVAHLYKNTSAGSPARKLVVELFADNNLEDWLIRAGDTLPREFLFDVMLRLVQKRPSVVFGNMLDRLSFNYHEEVNGTKETACESDSTMKRPASDELEAGEAGTSFMFKFSQGAKV